MEMMDDVSLVLGRFFSGEEIDFLMKDAAFKQAFHLAKSPDSIDQLLLQGLDLVRAGFA